MAVDVSSKKYAETSQAKNICRNVLYDMWGISGVCTLALTVAKPSSHYDRFAISVSDRSLLLFDLAWQDGKTSNTEGPRGARGNAAYPRAKIIVLWNCYVIENSDSISFSSTILPRSQWLIAYSCKLIRSKYSPPLQLIRFRGWVLMKNNETCNSLKFLKPSGLIDWAKCRLYNRWMLIKCSN